MTDFVPATGERADLVETLRHARFFLRNTLRELGAESADRRSTVSELNLAGLIKHVTITEGQWARFIVEGPAAMSGFTDADRARWRDAFRRVDGETVEGLLQAYAELARRTDELIMSLPDLDASHPLPPAQWFEPGARWSARRVVLHIITETAQHAGHADILRESIDGAKSMG